MISDMFLKIRAKIRTVLETALQAEGRLRFLDGFRAVAALLVLLYHAFPGTHYDRYLAESAILGVSIFFVLSGYLISRPFITAFIESNSLPDLRKYVIRRVFRIIPLYYAVIASIIIFSRLIPPFGYQNVTFSMISILKQLFFFQIFAPSSPLNSLVFTSWTLSLEVLFYLLIPVLFLLLSSFKFRRAPRRQVLLLSIALMMVISFTVRSVYPYESAVTGAVQLLGYLSLFCFGMLVAVIYKYFEHILNRRTVFYVIGAICLMLAFVAQPYGSQFISELFGLGFALILLAVLMPGTDIICKFMSWKPMAYLGTISYGIYLWQAVLTFYASYFHFYHLRTPTLLMLTITISSLSYFLIERPAIDWAKRWTNKRSTRAVEIEAITI